MYIYVWWLIIVSIRCCYWLINDLIIITQICMFMFQILPIWSVFIYFSFIISSSSSSSLSLLFIHLKLLFLSLRREEKKNNATVQYLFRRQLIIRISQQKQNDTASLFNSSRLLLLLLFWAVIINGSCRYFSVAAWLISFSLIHNAMLIFLYFFEEVIFILEVYALDILIIGLVYSSLYLYRF